MSESVDGLVLVVLCELVLFIHNKYVIIMMGNVVNMCGYAFWSLYCNMITILKPLYYFEL